MFRYISNIILAFSFIIGLASVEIVVALSLKSNHLIAIKGHPTLQNLPQSTTAGWNIWTFDSMINQLTPVEGKEEGDGWIRPTSFNKLFLPSDLPLPLTRPALGVALSNGIPRYIMPSIVLTLETPDMLWRNRGNQ